MTPNTTDNVVRFIDDHDYFYVLGHREPDGDCIGAQLALASLLNRRGKRAVALHDGPFDRPETETFAAAFQERAPEPAGGASAVIVCDCSTPERVSERYRPLLSLPVLVIDHHAAGEAFGNVCFTDAGAASTTTLVVRLFRALSDVPSGEEATLLFFGLATDTGFFRHCDHNCGEVFETAAFLVERGASPKKTYGMMYGNRSLGQRKLLGKLIEKAESHFGGRLILTAQTLAELREAGPNVRSSEELYSLFQTVRGVEVIIFLREEEADVVSVGLRSLRSVDVGQVARDHGGGGHMLASGFNYQGTLAEARGLVLAVFTGILDRAASDA